MLSICWVNGTQTLHSHWLKMTLRVNESVAYAFTKWLSHATLGTCGGRYWFLVWNMYAIHTLSNMYSTNYDTLQLFWCILYTYCFHFTEFIYLVTQLIKWWSTGWVRSPTGCHDIITENDKIKIVMIIILPINTTKIKNEP